MDNRKGPSQLEIDNAKRQCKTFFHNEKAAVYNHFHLRNGYIITQSGFSSVKTFFTLSLYIVLVGRPQCKGIRRSACGEG